MSSKKPPSSTDPVKRRSSDNIPEVLDGNIIGIITTDPAGRISTLNPAGETISGWTQDTAFGEPLEIVLRILDENSGIEIADPMNLILTDNRWGGPVVHTVLISRDGDKRPIIITGTFISDMEGLTTGAILAFHKKTPDQAKSRSLQENEALFRCVADFTYDWESWFGTDGQLRWVNPAVEQLTGFSISECLRISDYPLPLIHPQDREMMAKLLTESKEKSTSGNDVPFRIRKKDGAVVWAAVSWQPIYDHACNHIGQRTSVRDITERRLAEDALRKSEERFSLAQKVANVGSWDWNIQTGELYWSEQMEPMFGFGSGKFGATYDAFLECVHPEDRQQIIDSINASIELNKDYVIEHRIVWPDGTIRWILETGSVFRDIDDNAVRMIGLAQDISDRKRAEDACRISEERFLQVADNSQEWIWEVDASGLYTYASSVIQKILGYRPEDVVGKKHFYDLFHPDERDELKNTAFTVFEQKMPFRDFMNRNIHKNGNTIWLSTSGVPILDTKGNLLGYRGADTDITIRKRSEQKLHESELRYRSLFEGAAEGILVAEIQTMKFRYANSTMCNLLGYTESELRQLSVFDIHPQPDLDYVISEFAAQARGDKILAAAIPCLRKDGQIFYADIKTAKALVDGLECNIGFFSDITERKTAEERQQVHVHFLECLEQVNQAIQGTTEGEQMLWDVLKTVSSIFACDRAWLLYPCDPDAQSFRVPMEFNCPEYPGACALDLEVPMAPGQAQDMRDALASEDPVPYTFGTENTVSPETARDFNVQAQMFMALHPKIGKPWMLGMHQCAYARVWTQDECQLFKEIGRRIGDGLSSMLVLRGLQESEAKYRHLFNSGNDAVFVNLLVDDEPGVFSDVNDVACRRYGYSRADFQKMTIDDLDAESGPAETRQSIMDRLHAHGHMAFESVHVTRQGLVIPVEVDASIIEVDGKPVLYSIARDITERKQVEEELMKHRDHLEELVTERTTELAQINKELEAFSHSISHDLRAPLRHIDGFMELLQESMATKLDDQSRHYLTTISDSVMTMNLLITSLLALSQISRQDLVKRQIDIGNLIQEVIQECAQELENRDIRWQIADLPPVSGDFILLRTALSNLILNALKFTRSRQPAKIEIGSMPGSQGERVIFIRDNGVGFDMKYTDKLFGVFQRLHSAEEFEGTGIGLANVQRIIHRHGGRIWAEAGIDQGATFFFTIPDKPVRNDNGKA